MMLNLFKITTMTVMMMMMMMILRLILMKKAIAWMRKIGMIVMLRTVMMVTFSRRSVT